jgi:methylated-DNA-protein-cysteine methyltransferase related protein
MIEDHFFNRVYHVVSHIPPGRVTSYGAIARYLSAKSAARMVGWAMNASHHAPMNIPAHRVVNRNGMLTGKSHFGDPGLMQQLLENEGITVVDDVVQNFQQCMWDPSVELADNQYEKS